MNEWEHHQVLIPKMYLCHIYTIGSPVCPVHGRVLQEAHQAGHVSEGGGGTSSLHQQDLVPSLG